MVKHHLILKINILKIGWILLVLVGILIGPVGVAKADTTPPPGPGPQPVMSIDIIDGAGSSYPHNFVAIGDTVFFAAANKSSGQELFYSTPPYNNAVLVADINPGTGSSYPENLTVHGTTLFFRANDGVHGVELWRTEPPYNSATMVSDLNPGSASSTPHELTALGTALFFVADDGSTGKELWMTQTPFNTVREVADINPGSSSSSPEGLTTFGWLIFFSAQNSNGGREIWKAMPPYDSSSVTQVTDIWPNGNAKAGNLTSLHNILFFTANDGEYGQELWIMKDPYNRLSYRPVNDFSTRYYNTLPYDLYPLGDALFFSANIGTIGVEPWKVTPSYTTTQMVRVADINTTGYFQSSFPNKKISIGDTLFFVANDGKTGFELWKSVPPYDDDHTSRVKDIYPGIHSSNPEQLSVIGTTLYFSADDGTHGRELWESPTPYDTAYIVKDIWPGPSSGIRAEVPSEVSQTMTPINGGLFFQANNGVDGYEVWTLNVGGGLPSTGFAPGIVTAIGNQPAEKAYTNSSDLSLEIPTLGVQESIVGVPWKTNNWDLSWLGEQVGYLSGTAFPTLPGNTVLTGHSYLPSGLPGPFINLDKLKWGDQIVIQANGHRFIYEVRKVEQVSSHDMSPLGHEDHAWVTLLTCRGFDENKKEYTWRLVVKAVQVKVE